MEGTVVADFGDYSIMRATNGCFWACKKVGMRGCTPVVDFLYGNMNYKECELWLFEHA